MTLPDPVPAPADSSPLAPVPWGLGVTLLATFVIWAGSVAAQGFALRALPGLAAWAGLSGPALDEALGGLGFNWAVATLASTPVELAFILLFVLCRRACSIRDYLALRPVPPRTLSRWALGFIAFAVASDTLSWLLGRPLVPDIMREAYNSAAVPPLLWLALVVCAPLTEECLFRGFLLRGLEASPIGPWGAIGVTSVLWAAAHFQYEAPELLIVFAVGILLGLARLRTRSLYPCILLHALMNFMATLQLMLLA
jgi:hypothetical protein